MKRTARVIIPEVIKTRFATAHNTTIFNTYSQTTTQKTSFGWRIVIIDRVLLPKFRRSVKHYKLRVCTQGREKRNKKPENGVIENLRSRMLRKRP